MPAAFNYPQGTDVWKAVAPVLGDGVPDGNGGNPNPMRNVGAPFLVGRLNAGVSPEMARDAWTRDPRRCSPTRPARDTTSP